MFVCLCLGVTNQQVTSAVRAGACTSQQVANACGAGSDCGRCRRNLREIIASTGLGGERDCSASAGAWSARPVGVR
jgi:bacterioferritin-associated ferredoxin